MIRDVAMVVSSLLFLCCVANASGKQFKLPANLAGKKVLYVGAHPDDEWGVAPVLAEACVDRGAHCHFVVVAESKSYGCLLTIGLRDPIECSRRRRLEMQEAVAIFGGDVEFLGLEDLFYAFNQQGMQHVIRDWANSAGGRDRLVEKFLKILKREQPALVFTFDPRHGSSCHAAHRATATLLIEAIRRLPKARQPDVWLEQTTDIDEKVPKARAVIEALGYVGWPDTANETVWYDATRSLKDGRTGYDFAILDRKRFPSQMPDEASGKKVLNPPARTRHVPLARLNTAVNADYCTSLKLDRPTLDIPENRRRFGIGH